MAELNMRTTSSVESLNAYLRKKCSLHPHLFQFMDELKLVELKKALDMLNLIESKGPFERKNKRDKERDEKITFFTDLILKKEISIQTFFEAMANRTIMPMTGKSNSFGVSTVD